MIIKYFFLLNKILMVYLSEINEDCKKYNFGELETFYIRNESQIDKIFLYSSKKQKIIFKNFEELESYIYK